MQTININNFTPTEPAFIACLIPKTINNKIQELANIYTMGKKAPMIRNLLEYGLLYMKEKNIQNIEEYLNNAIEEEKIYTAATIEINTLQSINLLKKKYKISSRTKIVIMLLQLAFEYIEVGNDKN